MNCKLHLLIFFIFVFIAATGYSQVTVENLSFAKGLEKAKETNRLLMVVMDDVLEPRLNDSATKALADSNIYDVSNFVIVIRPDVTGEDWHRLNKRYYSFSAMGALFFNPRGVLVHRYDGINARGYAYLVEANAAKVYLDLPTEEEQFDELLKTNFSSIAGIKRLMDTRKKSNDSVSDLLQPFIDHTPADSFSSYPYFYLLARFAPVLGSQADSLLRNSSGFEEKWYQIDPKERGSINREIVKKTMNIATATHDENLAARLGNFAAGTLANSTPRLKSKYRVSLLTDFYFRIKDTAKYIQAATDLMDHYFMDLSLDSLKNVYIDRENERVRNNGQVTVFVPGATKENLAYFAEFRLLGSQLNQNAWQVYQMTSDPDSRLEALGWSKKSLEFNVTPQAIDTYARLLYVTGERKKGIAEEKKALEKYRDAKLEKSIPGIERTLKRMQNGDGKIDD